MTSSASLSFCLNCLDIWLGTNELVNLGKHCHWNVMCLGFYLSQRKRPLPSECVRVSPPRRFLLENFSVLSTVSILIPLRTNAYTKNCISGSVHFKIKQRNDVILWWDSGLFQSRYDRICWHQKWKYSDYFKKYTHNSKHKHTHSSFPKMESWSMYVLTHQYIVSSFLC